jgi:hypothetical protein
MTEQMGSVIIRSDEVGFGQVRNSQIESGQIVQIESNNVGSDGARYNWLREG